MYQLKQLGLLFLYIAHHLVRGAVLQLPLANPVYRLPTPSSIMIQPPKHVLLHVSQVSMLMPTTNVSLV